MSARIAADLLVALHLVFVLFVVFGAFLVLKWPRLAWLHLPAAAWGALIEFAGWVCPLTPLEQSLRRAAGDAGYAGGFIEHYLFPVLYPEGLTRGMQLALGLSVMLINVLLYGWILARRGRKSP